MLIVRATQKLLHLTGPPTAAADDTGTTLLGPWCATVLAWRTRAVLLVNERTLLPVLLPQAPSTTLTSRIASQITTVLAAHNASAAFIDQEREHMRTCQLSKNMNRSAVGVMTEFAHLADAYRNPGSTPDLLELSLRLARTPCSPLRRTTGFPDRELAAVLRLLTAD